MLNNLLNQKDNNEQGMECSSIPVGNLSTSIVKFYVFYEEHYIGWDCFDKTIVTAGNGQTADLVLPGDEISEIQAEFHIKNDRIFVVSEGKQDLLKVNGKTVANSLISMFDVVSIGKFTLKIKLKNLNNKLSIDYGFTKKSDPNDKDKKPVRNGGDEVFKELVRESKYTDKNKKVALSSLEKKQQSQTGRSITVDSAICGTNNSSCSDDSSLIEYDKSLEQFLSDPLFFYDDVDLSESNHEQDISANVTEIQNTVAVDKNTGRECITNTNDSLTISDDPKELQSKCLLQLDLNERLYDQEIRNGPLDNKRTFHIDLRVQDNHIDKIINDIFDDFENDESNKKDVHISDGIQAKIECIKTEDTFDKSHHAGENEIKNNLKFEDIHTINPDSKVTNSIWNSKTENKKDIPKKPGNISELIDFLQKDDGNIEDNHIFESKNIEKKYGIVNESLSCIEGNIEGFFSESEIDFTKNSLTEKPVSDDYDLSCESKYNVVKEELELSLYDFDKSEKTEGDDSLSDINKYEIIGNC